jgi:hypothetical protein
MEVKEALRRGKRECHIVHSDWLEFSCIRNKKLPEAEYSMRKVLERERQERLREQKVEKGKQIGEKLVNPSG